MNKGKKKNWQYLSDGTGKTFNYFLYGYGNIYTFSIQKEKTYRTKM